MDKKEMIETLVDEAMKQIVGGGKCGEGKCGEGSDIW